MKFCGVGDSHLEEPGLLCYSGQTSPDVCALKGQDVPWKLNTVRLWQHASLLQCRWKPSWGLLVYLLGPSQKSTCWFTQKLVDVKPFHWFLPLGKSFLSNADGEFGYKQSMVCPAFCATHCLVHHYMLHLLHYGEDEVYQVPVSASKTSYFDRAGGIQCSW